MTGRYVWRAAAAGALCLVVSGCSGSVGGWQLPSFMRSSPPATPARVYQPSAGDELNSNPPSAGIVKRHKTARARHPADRVVPAAIAPAPVATPEPPVEAIPQPTVTLAKGPSKERAQHLLDDTGTRLSKVNRNTLGADSATTYDQANNFLQAGRKAATEDDYVAASGYAEKAAVLAAKLVPASP
jgi:hypothetical protein